MGTIPQLSQAISSQLRHVSTIRKKNLLSSNISSTCPHNMVNISPLAAEIVLLVWGTSANFNGFRVLAAILHGTLVVSVSQTLRRWTEGTTYIWQGAISSWKTNFNFILVINYIIILLKLQLQFTNILLTFTSTLITLYMFKKSTARCSNKPTNNWTFILIKQCSAVTEIPHDPPYQFFLWVCGAWHIISIFVVLTVNWN